MTLEFHPFANLFPLIEGDAFAALVEDVRKNGVREPVVLYDGKILDGRNRYRAALEAGVTAHTQKARVSTDREALDLVISLNLHRRHLSESQRAMVAAELAIAEGGLTQAQAAEALAVSPRTVADAVLVTKQGDEATKQAVKTGKKRVSKAAEEVKTAKDPARAERKAKKVSPPPLDISPRPKKKAAEPAPSRSLEQIIGSAVGVEPEEVPAFLKKSAVANPTEPRPEPAPAPEVYASPVQRSLAAKSPFELLVHAWERADAKERKRFLDQVGLKHATEALPIPTEV